MKTKIFLLSSLFLLTGNIFSQIPSFPCAEGFGTTTPGGRGGQVIQVTNLNDDGPGSLRAALTTSGPHVVVFRVGGTIELASRIELTEPYVTVVGQTATGGGITITRGSTMTEKGLMRIFTHDVVMRYLRLRNLPPTGGSGQVDALTMNEAYNIVIDHCSFSWATDEVVQTENGHDFTIQWCIIAEGLSHSTHPEGEHSKALHFRGENSDNISVHHNLMAHNTTRNPNINTTGTVDMVNNVIYNGGELWTTVKDKFGSPHVNAIGNYYKKGPSSQDEEDKPLRAKGYEIAFYESSSSLGLDPKIYVEGNIGFHRTSNTQVEEMIVEKSSRFMLVNNRFTAPTITTVSATEAFELVLDNAGATLPARDAHDIRVANDAKNGTGKIIDDPSEVGGLLVMASGTPPVDTDSDGMPNAWEIQHGLNPNNPADRNGIAPSGYTWVEEYINELAGSNCSPIITSTQEFVANSPFIEIYPNPANDKFTLKWMSKQLSENVELKIVNVLGQTVFTETFISDNENKRTVDTQSFKNGIYVICLKNNQGVLTQKLFINH